MASCLVPELQAVRIALERLGELDKRLRDEGGSFTKEASQHFIEMMEAIRELESSRKAARERLEVATIETSKLRHGAISLEDDIEREISGDFFVLEETVSAARTANAARMTQLQSEMKAVGNEIKAMEEKQQLLEQENAACIYEQENSKESYEDVVDQMNQHLSNKVSMQMKLKEKQEEILSMKKQIIQVEMNHKDLKANKTEMIKAFAEGNYSLQKKVEEIDISVKKQRKINGEKRRELDSLVSELHDKDETVAQCEKHMSQLDKNIIKMKAIKAHFTKWLGEAAFKTEEAEKQKGILKRELDELADQLTLKVEAVQQRITKVENELKDEQKAKSSLSEQCAKVSDIFSTQRKEEDKMIAQLNLLSKQLEESKKKNDEDILFIAKCKYEIKNMKNEMRQLQDANIINADMSKKSLEDLEGQLAKEKLTRSVFEAKRANITQSLKSLKEDHWVFVKDMNSAILQTQKRYGELLKEEKKLQDHELLNLVIEELTEELRNTEKEEKLVEANYKNELQKFSSEEESITQCRTEREQQLKLQESALETLESQFNLECLKHQSLKSQITEFETQKSQLELSIQEVIQQSAALIQPKDDLKRQLVTLRGRHMEMLRTYTAEISSVEKRIYENQVLLEQVTMENSRLHVCIEQMKEDVVQAKKDKQKYTHETKRMEEEIISLSKSLIETWATNVVLTEESADQDQKVVENINSLLERIKERKHCISNINNRVEKELLGMRSMLMKPLCKHHDITI
ncbi:hypothetical protein DNTS_027328 [Danionella cerebrum]|uniref:Uncharacterized protein n=1 Tax=Danionella cerebrum TaxID=2873325 RepID=A0A553QVU4_9TELE|nr:hypothetical protein DNTS_027328 [Danionella translucida]